MKEKDLIVEVKVAVKIELKVASKAVLTAKVHGGLKNSSLTSAVSTLAPFSQKGKGKAKNNWRERPVCARPHGSFQRTLPGELSRAIFLARVNNGQSIPLTENAMSVSNASVDKTMEANAADGSSFSEQKTRTRKRVIASRKISKEKDFEIECKRTKLREPSTPCTQICPNYL